MCRSSTHSSFRNSSFCSMTSLTIHKTVYELQTIAPTIVHYGKVLGQSVSLNMTLIGTNEKFQAYSCMAAASLLMAQNPYNVTICSQHDPFQFRSQRGHTTD